MGGGDTCIARLITKRMENGTKSAAQIFFESLAGTATEQDTPPEKTSKYVRIKVSHTPWVLPSVIDKRFGE